MRAEITSQSKQSRGIIPETRTSVKDSQTTTSLSKYTTYAQQTCYESSLNLRPQMQVLQLTNIYRSSIRSV